VVTRFTTSHPRRRALAGLVLALAALVIAPAGRPAPAGAATSPCGPTRTVPRITHIVVIAFENHSYASVLGPSAPDTWS
jgi:hypothetical protein